MQDEIFNKRPEQLSVQQFVELTNMVENELVLMNSQQH
ncbi:dimethyladenosine transferase [Bacteroides graminisolvens DSM 19988 = JCM 15093]|uniref:Dimethyladenosine transferase n=1 Tax=Bacteroides graminisolvens DSM 19988 = JCM 15093 TaxID=1121097 RepID=A0A069D055_9BACE|nr:dimethyladenosine transferase [Bacteroides graminisolvens DSM 19988 = JCM 15093]